MRETTLQTGFHFIPTRGRRTTTRLSRFGVHAAFFSHRADLVFARTRRKVRRALYLPTYLPACLPACLPASLPACSLACLVACLPARSPSFHNFLFPFRASSRFTSRFDFSSFKETTSENGEREKDGAFTGTSHLDWCLFYLFALFFLSQRLRRRVHFGIESGQSWTNRDFGHIVYSVRVLVYQKVSSFISKNSRK